MDTVPSLTKVEAEERSGLLDVIRYDIHVDLTDMLEGTDFRAVSTVRFSCRAPGSSTFVDAAFDVVSATLNGVPIGADQISAGRITLTDLADDNVLIVESVQSETSAGTRAHRSVDPSDNEVYVWTTFEPDEARYAWACFDQPDLKAPHAFTVVAPGGWTVVSNTGDPVVTPHDRGRRWQFPDTPALSTYVPVINAGPFHEIRSERDGFDLGLLCRRSLAQFLERDAEELFELTALGLTFYGDRFGLPFPQQKYDQVFVPDMGGAMENYGCVTWSDVSVYRSAPTFSDRERRAIVLLHEMAHMWFGDIVTMKWWDDLWLNEAFATWASHWAAEAVTTHFSDAWSSFLAGRKLAGYAADMAPTTHPIRQPADDVAAAAAGFDGITYPKGASALKQLFALVGEQACVAGLRSYFAKYAWGNTTLTDLMRELELASGRDLAGWTEGWLDTAGTDRLSLETLNDGGTVLRAVGPNGIPARPHRLDVGVYDRGTDGVSLVRRQLVALESTRDTTDVPDVANAALLLVNDEDLTFASVRPDAMSRQSMLDSVTQLPSALSRAVVVTTAWDMLVWGELAATDFVRCVTGVLASEPADSLIEDYLALAVDAADMWSSDSHRNALLGQVADTCLELSGNPTRQRAATRALAQTAVTDEHIAALRSLAGDDIDLRWRALTRLAEVDSVDPAEVDQLVADDPDPDSWVRALAVESARPDPTKKEATWKAITESRRVPRGALASIGRAFWRRSQGEILAPYADRYLHALPTLHLGGMISALGLSSTLYPKAGVGADFAEKAVAAAKGAGVSPPVAKTVIEQTDRLNRMVTARAI